MSLRTTIIGIAVSRGFTRAFRAVLVAAAMIAALAGLARAQAYTPCVLVDARVSVATSYEPGLLGTYRYTLTVTWDVGWHDPSHLDFLLGLNECLCVCDSRIVRFIGQAGTSSGVNGAGGACAVPYSGAYVCKGDPAIRNGLADAAIKFVPGVTACVTDEAGSGTFVFHSPLPPGPLERQENAIAIKHRNSTGYGALVGQLPACDCSVPAAAKSWGQLKSFYC